MKRRRCHQWTILDLNLATTRQALIIPMRRPTTDGMMSGIPEKESALTNITSGVRSLRRDQMSMTSTKEQ